MTKDGKMTYVILGMHKSATSFIAHSFKNMGVFLGDDLMKSNEVNPMNECESKEWELLCNDIITFLGGKWGMLAEISEGEYNKNKIEKARKYFADRIRNLIKKTMDGADSMWGWKSPKTIRVIDVIFPFILEVDNDPYVFAVLRDPIKIGKTVKEKMDKVGKDWVTNELGQKVAEQYHNKIVNFINENYAGKK